MRRITITNLKGGVGKTTTAVNLAAGLARKLQERDERVLLIDLDPQVEASASSWLDRSDPDNQLLQALRGEVDIAHLVQTTDVPGLDLVPGCSGLSRAEVLLADEPGSETVLAGVVSDLPQNWSVVLIDTPPAQGWLMHSALTAASDVLVVIESGAMALGSLTGLDRVVSLVRKRLNPQLELFGVLQCRADARTRLYREVDDLLKAQFPSEALSTIIRTDVRLLEAPGHRQDIFSYAPTSRAAEDFETLAGEVGQRLGLTGF